MTEQTLLETYCGRYVDEDRLFQHFRMMGKFGKASIYTTEFNTADYTVSIEVMVERGKMTGITLDKELRDDGWGVNPEPGPEEIQPEEYDRIAMYLGSVVEK